MGNTIKELAKKDIESRSIFNNRFVVEICEKVHVHYRALRLNLSLSDFLEMAQGMSKSLERWAKIGNPEPKKGVHIELCRRKVAQDVHNDGLQVNFNSNLYDVHKGQIFAEGADLKDKAYIHLKIRDMRIELTEKDFKDLADVVGTAKSIQEAKSEQNSDTNYSI